LYIAKQLPMLVSTYQVWVRLTTPLSRPIYVVFITKKHTR